MGIYFRRDQEFDGILIPAAKRWAVPLWLAKGLIATESGWDPQAATYEPSHANTPKPGDRDASFGLMQVTGEAAEGMGTKFPSTTKPGPDGKPKKFYDLTALKALGEPGLNAELGMHELYMRIKKYASAGDVVAAYNMGYPRKIADSTMFIAKIYDKWAIDQGYGSYVANFEAWKKAPPPGWVYANQPYVNRVLSYAALYKAAEEGRPADVASITAALKKKTCPESFKGITALSALDCSSSLSRLG